MTNYLDKIIKTKSEVVEVQKSSQSLQSIKIQLNDSAPRRGFISAIQERNDKGQLCFEFPIIIRTREDKPLNECEV